MIRHKGKLLWVFLLSAALVVTQLPAVAMAENKTPEDKSIASFEALPDTVKAQTVPTGTEESELDLPAELTAEVYRVTDKPPVTEDTGTPDADSDSGITVSTATEQIPVTWSSAPAYDSGAEGCYVFTADTGRYPLSNEVTPPQITVTVEEGIMEEETETLQEGPIPCTKTEGCTLSEGHEGGCVLAPPVENSLVKTITGWTFVDDDYLNMGELPLHGVNRKNQANFDTVVSMLPTQLLAEIEDQEESAMVDITGWTCSAFQQDGNGNWPITREYTFTAVLPTDYACDPFPTVKVRLGETDNPGGETGYFTVTGGSLNTDYKYENNVLTILKSTVLTITGSGQTTTDTIVVPNGVTANVTLQDVSIDVSSSTGKSRAFSVEAGGTSNITLSGTNILTSDFYYAGVEVPENASVTFDGDGSLTATSDYGAGIGSSGGSCGMISIYGGNITAISDIGAGIGGGSSGGSENGGSGGTISIYGGNVRATGGYGAGIGGGGIISNNGGSGGTISIYGGNVRATGGYGAGIGGGNKFGSGGTITISGGTVIAMGGNGAGIGGGSNGSGGKITIRDNAHVTATATDYGAGIGGGGYNGNGGIIKLLGGIVNATGGSGIYSGAGVGGGGSPQGTGNGGEITIDGDVVLFAAGGTGVNPAEAIGSGGNSSQDGTIVKNTGMVFEDKTGMVHGCPNLPGEVKIPSGSTLTVPDGSTLTVLDGSTLINNGTLENFGTVNGAGNIQNNGTINDNSNGISVNINGSRANKPSAVDIIFQNSQNGLITKAIYGDTIRITATARKAADTRLRSAAVNQVTFYIESIAPEHKLGETTVITSGETATATLEITLSGNEWNKGFVFGVNTILADFGGAAALNLLADTGSKNLTMEKAAQTTPAAPTLSSRTDTSITLNSVSGQKYTFTTSDTPPAITIAGWKTASGPTLTFDGLTDGTSYWFWTYIPEDSTHKNSSLSNSLPSTTYVSTAEVTITEPAVGIVPDTTAAVHGNTGYTVEKTTWTEGTTPQTGSFAYNTAYSVSIELKAKADFQFAGNVNGSINGNTAMVHVLNNSSVILSYTFPKIGTQSGGSSSSSGGNHDSSGSDSSSASMIIPKDSYLITGDRINKPIPRSDLQWLVDSAKSLTFSCDKASMTFDPAALRAILAAVPSTAGTITFTAAPADLSAFLYASAQIGSHPVYDFTITYKDSKGNTVTVNVAFPAGSASVTLTCPLSAAETEGSLFMVCVDDKGNVTWLDKSSYDSGRMLADAPHFSVYGTAYKAPAVVFTDTEDHWAKNDIEFAAARGLLSATGNGLFSPDAAMTRGMFVTALGRLAGINPVSYTIRSFTDVKADDYYAPYVEWAAQQNIVKGTGEGLFSPDVPVTREQMAVILTKYAGQMGYSLPATLTEAAFSDNDAISAWAAKEVTAMQRAGIVKDKDGNRFDPQGNTTRAEISVVLHRFVEIVIDPATANGWGKNDSGQWFYYRNGKALTGWQTIGKQNYYFNTNGVRE